MQNQATYYTNLSVKSYHPFGMAMPGRSYTNESYRYGFNGMEKDNEIAQGDLDFGSRIYDSRLGRWLSLDPLMAKYPDMSPYNFGLNNPIMLIDIDGEDVFGFKELENSNLYSSTIKLANFSSIFQNTMSNLDKNHKINVHVTHGNVGNSSTKAISSIAVVLNDGSVSTLAQYNQNGGNGSDIQNFQITLALNDNVLTQNNDTREIEMAVGIVHDVINHVEKFSDYITDMLSNGASMQDIYNGIINGNAGTEDSHHNDFNDSNSKVNQAFEELINNSKGGDSNIKTIVKQLGDNILSEGYESVEEPIESTSNTFVRVINSHNEQHGSNVKFKEETRKVWKEKK